MKNSLVCISGVRGYEEDGVAYLHIEDSARGLGFTQIKDGVSYVRWETVEHHLDSLKFLSQLDGKMLERHDYFIPENIFYRLCMSVSKHVGVIERLHEMVQADETLMAKYRKIASV